MNIYLIGFMGCGKSSIGEKLSQSLNWPFVDLDEKIERNESKSIPDIFAEKGEDGFRKIERRILSETFGGKNKIIATGGGAPCFFDNIEQINANGYSFYLRNTVGFFVDKLMNAKRERPLVKGKSKEELHEYIDKTLKYREQFYSQAHFVIPMHLLNKKKATRMIEGMLLHVED